MRSPLPDYLAVHEQIARDALAEAERLRTMAQQREDEALRALRHLTRAGFDVRACDIAGMSRATLYRRMTEAVSRTSRRSQSQQGHPSRNLSRENRDSARRDGRAGG